MTDVQASARTLVLTNSDLLDCILTFVAAPRMPGTRSKWHDPNRLVPCLTVCRSFHELVIRLLWRSLPSLFPLWHLLAPPNTERPPGSFSLQDDKRLDYLRKVVSARLYDDPLVWERFLWYTTRVRHIAHSTYSSDSPETTVHHLLLIQAVVSRNGENPVLPLLRSILWAARAPTDSSLVALFTSTLRSASFSLESEPGDEGTRALLFRRLHDSSPYLEKLEIGSEYNSDKDLAVGLRLVQELLSFVRLRHLTVHCGLSGPAAFLALISKPNLASLSIRNVTGPLGAPSPPTLVRDLVELSIMDTGPTLVGLFKLVRLETLKSAAIRIQNSPSIQQETEEVLKAFYNALPTPSTLHSLTLRIAGWGSSTEFAAIGLRDLMRPVLPLPEIRSFAFSGHALRPLIEVPDIAALTDAWPKMKRLVLNVPPPSKSGHDAFSLDALHYIHAHCPQIQELETHSVHLPVLGVHAIPAPLDRSGLPPHGLRRLWAGGVYVYRPGYTPGRILPEHAEALARYLLELFPALDTEEYKQWIPRPGVRQTSAPGHCFDGRKVLARMYTITSERERGLQ